LCFLDYQTMDKAPKLSNPECHVLFESILSESDQYPAIYITSNFQQQFQPEND
jgi:hypothetical protein